MPAAPTTLFDQTMLFRFATPEQRARLQPLLQPMTFEFGDVLVKQGDDADAFFVITAGRCRVVRRTECGDEIVLTSLRVGDEFGESALADGGHRNATVRASSAVTALRLDRADFQRLVAEMPDLREALEAVSKHRAARNFLYEFTQFGKLPAATVDRLIAKLETTAVPRGAAIVREGEAGGPLFLLKSGRARAFANGEGPRRHLAFYRAGDVFGELSLLTGAPRAATVEAVSNCELISLTPEAVLQLRAESPEFARLLEDRRAGYGAAEEARVPLDFAEEMLPAAASVTDKVALDEPAAAEAEAEPPAEEDPFADNQGHFRKNPRRIRRFPFLPQIDAMDCGAASLGMICRHFGRKVSLARIRPLCHTSTDGTSLKAICSAANDLGLAARALKVSLRNLPNLPVPAIVHWEGNHWMVLFDVQKKFVRVADPGAGIRRIPRAEFEQKWSGYAALFDHTEAFIGAPEGKSILTLLAPFFLRHRATLVQVLLLAAIANVLELLFPVFTQTIMDQVVVDKDPQLLTIILLGLAAAVAFSQVTKLIQEFLLSFTAVRLDAAILDFLTRRMLALPMAYFHSRRTGDIQRRLEGAREVRRFLVQQGVGGVLAVLQLGGALGLMALYSPMLTGVFLLTAPLYVGLMFFSSKFLRPLYADLEEAQGRYSSHQIDAIKGIEAVKAAAAELSFRDTMLNEFLAVSRKMFRSNFIMMGYGSALNTVCLISNGLFLWFGARLVMAGGLTIGGFVAFSALTGMCHGAIVHALGIWDEVQLAGVLLHRLNDIFEHEPEQGNDRSSLKPVRSVAGRIDLRNVGFKYGGAESPDILKGITLEIPAAKMVAIVGRSGCGKTTLIKLLAGLIEPTEGTILYDHLDLKTLNYRELRRQIGMVLQENHLFDTTILQNIAFGDAEPDVERVFRSAQVAAAHDFITRLPLGYETRIGETGLALSGGQRQRIAIARALYHNPPILIFDEATSALDTESERAIQENLRRLMAGRTTLVIAHRLSTIREADMIVVLEKGRVAEVGSHDQLMAQRGLYFYLSSQQLGLSS